MVTGEGTSWTPPPPPYSSPAANEPVMLGLEYERTEFTLQEVLSRVADLQRVIGDVRKQKEEAIQRRAAQRAEKVAAEEWRHELTSRLEGSGSELQENIEELELKLYRVQEARHKKEVALKKQRERLKCEISQLEAAGQQFVDFETELRHSISADAKRLSERSRLVFEATMMGLNEKMEALVSLGETQYNRNQELIASLEAEVAQQRAVFWENQKRKRYGQELQRAPSLVPITDAETLRAVDRVKSGDVVVRHHFKTGQREDIWLQVDGPGLHLSWQRLDAEGNAILMTASRLALQTDVVDVVFGALSAAFVASRQEPPLPWMGLTVVEKSGSSMNLSFADEETALTWFLGLQALIPSDSRLDGAIRHRRLSHNDIVWLRARMKIDYAARKHALTPVVYLCRKMSVASRLPRQPQGKTMRDVLFTPRNAAADSLPLEAPTSSVPDVRVEAFGSRALELAVQEKLLSQQDLVRMSDRELRAKIVGAVEFNVPLQQLFRAERRLRKRAVRRQQKPAAGNSLGGPQSAVYRDMVGVVAEAITPRHAVGITTPRTAVLLQQTPRSERITDGAAVLSPRSGGEGIGVALLQQAVREGLVSLEDLTSMSDEALRSKIVDALERSETLRNLLRSYLKSRGRLPEDQPRQESESESDNSQGGVSDVEAEIDNGVVNGDK